MDRNEKRNTFKNVQNKRNTKNSAQSARAGMIVALAAAVFFAVCAFTFGLKYLEERDESSMLRAELSFYQKHGGSERDQTEPESELTAAESELTAAESELTAAESEPISADLQGQTMSESGTVSGDGQNGQIAPAGDVQTAPENDAISGDGQNGQVVSGDGQNVQIVQESETRTEELDFIDGLSLHTQPRSN